MPVRRLSLPNLVNQFMNENAPEYQTIVDYRRRCRLEVVISVNKSSAIDVSSSPRPKTVTIEVIEVSIILPNFKSLVGPRPGKAYSLRRRTTDGYFDFTRMFSAAFPYATAGDTQEKMAGIEVLSSVTLYQLGNSIWVPAEFALELAADYQILPWVKALLDDAPVKWHTNKNRIPKDLQLKQPEIMASLPSQTTPNNSNPAATSGQLAGTSTLRSELEPDLTDTILKLIDSRQHQAQSVH